MGTARGSQSGIAGKAVLLDGLMESHVLTVPMADVSFVSHLLQVPNFTGLAQAISRRTD